MGLKRETIVDRVYAEHFPNGFNVPRDTPERHIITILTTSGELFRHDLDQPGSFFRKEEINGTTFLSLRQAINHPTNGPTFTDNTLPVWFIRKQFFCGLRGVELMTNDDLGQPAEDLRNWQNYVPLATITEDELDQLEELYYTTPRRKFRRASPK